MNTSRDGAIDQLQTLKDDIVTGKSKFQEIASRYSDSSSAKPGADLGVSNCYVFKSRLQEYAQKAGLVTPVYETVKEGPSHEPYFRSTVIVDNVRYDSLPGFFNRKAAEQSAAEIALMELAKSGNINESISHPVHETGLCKNLLQEYAQKMNYAIPSYIHHKDETPGKASTFSCTVEIGGIQYIGAAARTKKEAEIKAARTALLAIQSNASASEAKSNGTSQLTVLPCKKKGTELDTKQAMNPLKPKKARLKKKWPKRNLSRNKVNVAINDQTEHATSNVENALGLQGLYPGALVANTDVDGGVSITETNNNFQNEQITTLNLNPNEQGISTMGIFSGVQINDLVTLVTEVNKVAGVGPVIQMGEDLNSKKVCRL